MSVHKRKADGRLGPDRDAPSSAERKVKGLKCHAENDEANDEVVQEEEDQRMVEDSESGEEGDTVEDSEMEPPNVSAQHQIGKGTAKVGPSSVTGNGNTISGRGHRPPVASKDTSVAIQKTGGVQKARAPAGREGNKKTRLVSGVAATGSQATTSQ